jgi:hypothetical protein
MLVDKWVNSNWRPRIERLFESLREECSAYKEGENEQEKKNK